MSGVDEGEVMALRRLGFARCATLGEGVGSPWDGRDPRAALASVLPELASAAEPVALYQHRGAWHLAWRTRSGLLLGGGPPNPSPELSEEWEGSGWTVPPALARLYGAHDGLGPIDGPRAHLWRDAVASAGELVPLSHRTHFGEGGILYPPGDLLLFSPDGRGGGACFHRADPDDPEPPVRAWDAGTRSLGPTGPFEAFVGALVGRWTR